MPVDRPPFDRPIVDQMILDVGAGAFTRLAKLFIDETADELDALDALASKAQDIKELGRRAHSLKNSAGSFGLADLADAARELEAASDSANPQAAARAATRLRVVCNAGMSDLLNVIAEVSGLTDRQE